jgi:RNA polymerase sigma-70 factor, ECF subfamily
MSKEQIEEYFRKYYACVYRAAFSQVKSHGDAEDVLQEVFIRLLRYQPDFESSEHEKAWIIRTTLNLCKDLQKSKWNSTTVGIDKIVETDLQKSCFTHKLMEEDNLLQVVLSLPEKYRNCLFFFYYEDYSIKELASLLGMTENTVKTNLKRGREILKDTIGKEK